MGIFNDNVDENSINNKPSRNTYPRHETLEAKVKERKRKKCFAKGKESLISDGLIHKVKMSYVSNGIYSSEDCLV